MNAAPVHVDEIHDIPGGRTIDEVANRAAKDQREAEAGEPLLWRQGERISRDGAECHERDRHHHHRLILELDVVQHAEGGAGVSYVREIEQSGNDVEAVVQGQLRPNDRLGNLVQRDDDDRRPQL